MLNDVTTNKPESNLEEETALREHLRKILDDWEQQLLKNNQQE